MSINKSMQITLSCAGKRIKIGTKGDVRLLGHSGFDAADIDLQMQSSGAQDGGYITVARLASRTLTIITDTAGADPEGLRARVIGMMRPDVDITVMVTRCGITRTIGARLQNISIAEANMYHPSTVTIVLLCADPYFRDVDDFGRNLAQTTPGIHFPLAIPSSGLLCGYRASGGQAGQ